MTHINIKVSAYSLVELLVVMAIMSFLIIGSWGVINYAWIKVRDHKKIDLVERVYEDYEVLCRNRYGTSCASLFRIFGARHGWGGIHPVVINSHNVYYGALGRCVGCHLDSGSLGIYIDIDSTYPTWAMCILLEGKHEDSKVPGYYASPASVTDVNTRGCYCKGGARDYARCYGLTHASGVWGSEEEIINFEKILLR